MLGAYSTLLKVTVLIVLLTQRRLSLIVPVPRTLTILAPILILLQVGA
jgi:hypothetical protein